MSEAAKTQVDAAPTASRKRSILPMILIGIAIAIIFYYFYSRAKERMEAEGLGSPMEALLTSARGGIRSFDKSGTPELAPKIQNRLAQSAGSSPDQMLSLAKRVKASGLRIMGASWCGATVAQREMFGGRDSEARRIIESVYTECRSPEMCPNVRAYPTWAFSDKRFPGYKNYASLSALVNHVQEMNPEPMIMGASEPSDEAVPEARSNEKPGNMMLTPEMAEQLMQMLADNEKQKKLQDAVAEAESNRQQGGQKLGGAETTKEAEDTTGGFQKDNAGGSLPGDKGGSDPGVKKENVRGVSNHPPLNVPDMPGTHVWALDMQHHDDQTRQGNAPRANFEAPMPTPGIVNQMISQFNHAVVQSNEPDEAGAAYSQTRQPHSRSITTGDAINNPSVPKKKN